jgi:glycosyltransferase involved in cell wall biosynthesis
LAIIEPNAASAGGHFGDPLVALASAARAEGRLVAVVALDGTAASTRADLHASGAEVYQRPGRGELAAWLLLAAGLACRRLAALARRTLPRWRLPNQLILVGRCLTEAASLRVARVALAPHQPVAVLLTASEALHGLVALLAGTPHLRIVHEVYTTEAAVVRLLGWAGRSGERKVLVICTTSAVRHDLSRRFPRLSTDVRPFTLLDPEGYLDPKQRQAARAAFGLAHADLAVSLVGGWWWYKDIDTVQRALAQLRNELHLIVAGSPVDHTVLDRMAMTPGVRLHVLARDLDFDEVRQVYAASDATLVSRRPGVAKESGLVMDAARLGVPLVVSDHDPVLTGLLAGEAWVRLFRAGDPADLAATLDALADHPPGRPTVADARRMGMMTAAQAVAYFTTHQQTLTPAGTL